MFGFNPHLANALKNQAVASQNAGFDGIQEAVQQIAINPIDEKRAIHAISELRGQAFAVVLNTASIVSEQDSDDEEAATPSEVLDYLIQSVFGDDGDDDDNEIVSTHLTAHIYDVLDYIGVDGTIISDMFGDDVELADSAVERMTEIIIENLPDDGEPLDNWVDAFVYGDESDDESDDVGLDSATKVHFTKNSSKATLGGTTIKRMGKNKTAVRYKGVKAIRNGKMVVVNKRVGGGKIVLSAKQKSALKKAAQKSKKSSARRKMALSLKKGNRMGIYKENRTGAYT